MQFGGIILGGGDGTSSLCRKQVGEFKLGLRGLLASILADAAALEIERGQDYLIAMDQTPPPHLPASHPELESPVSQPHVAVAPGLPDQDHLVIRAQDDTDEDYAARSHLLALALAAAAPR